MSKRERTNYFELLEQATHFVGRAAAMLEESLQNFEPERIAERCKEMHEIEHQADLAHHDLISRLSQEFITPIEREDIAHLSDEVDDVVDAFEDILLRFYIFNAQRIRPEALDFIQVLKRQSVQLSQLMLQFKDFQHEAAIKNTIVEINRLEEEGDRIYYAALRRLYTEEQDSLEVLKWTEIYRRFESCCDAIEDLSQLVENVIMKNS